LNLKFGILYIVPIIGDRRNTETTDAGVDGVFFCKIEVVENIVVPKNKRPFSIFHEIVFHIIIIYNIILYILFDNITIKVV